MNSLDYLHIGLNSWAVFMYLRSLFYLLRIRKESSKFNLAVMVTGIVLMLYKISTTIPDPQSESLLWSLGHIATGYVFYIVARNKKEKYYTPSKLYKETLTFMEKRMLKGFSSMTDPELVTKAELDVLEVGKVFQLNDKVQFEKVVNYKGDYHFVTTMLPGGTFGLHSHDCFEKCIPYIGELICPCKGEKQRFGKNEEVVFGPNEAHRPYVEKFTVLRVYFY